MGNKILELVQSMEKGGRTKRIAETAIGLSEKGWQVKVLPMTATPSWVRSIYDGTLDWLTLNRQPRLDLQYPFQLARLIHRENISLVHAHCEASFLYGGLAGRLCGVPVVGTYHRSDLNYFQPSLRLRSFATLLTHSVAISNDRRDLMIRNLRTSAERITLIHGGVDPARYSPAEASEVLRLKAQLGVEPHRRLLLSVGHLGPIKGHDTTLEALAQLVAAFPDLLLVIAGDGEKEDYSRLEATISRLDLASHVRLLGQVHNVKDWLNACEFFIQPSIEEGFGLVFVEAGACGKAVVATAVGGIKDIVVPEETGLLVPPADPDALAGAIGRLLQDPGLSTRFGTAAVARVSQHFTIEGMVAKYDSLFAGLVKPRG